MGFAASGVEAVRTVEPARRNNTKIQVKRIQDLQIYRVEISSYS
jgi:hypothetical protein